MTRVLVVGGGIAGLWTAVRAADAGCEVELVTKTRLAEGSTSHAQGGIAAALFADDSAERHFADTIAAGAGLCDPAAVRVLCEEGPARVRDLIRFGVGFDRDDSGLSRGLEAAHSRARIVHAGGDATGAAIEAALVATVRRRAVAIHEDTMLVDLVVDDGAVVGALLLGPDGALVRRFPDRVVLATGGAGMLYRHTTNPAVATGDGVAAAARAGAEVADLEFVQFHPTALAVPGTPLISEAVRGEGAVLRDASGRRFMLDVHPLAELAPRDVVARGVWHAMLAQGGAPVLLDATALGRGFLARRFPGLDRLVREAGLDWAVEPVPVIPAAHYAMGGIAADLDARTSLANLFAVGECARTGVHGANRLASNSLLEAAVFAERAARALVEPAAPASISSPAPAASARSVGRVDGHAVSSPAPGGASPGSSDIPDGCAAGRHDGHAGGPASAAPAADRSAVDRTALRDLMQRFAGLERSAAGLAEASAQLDRWVAPEPIDRRSAEDRNLLDLARLTVAAALARGRSVGAHFRVDEPAAGVAAPQPADPTAPDLEEAA